MVPSDRDRRLPGDRVEVALAGRIEEVGTLATHESPVEAECLEQPVESRIDQFGVPGAGVRALLQDRIEIEGRHDKTRRG